MSVLVTFFSLSFLADSVTILTRIVLVPRPVSVVFTFYVQTHRLSNNECVFTFFKCLTALSLS